MAIMAEDMSDDGSTTTKSDVKWRQRVILLRTLMLCMLWAGVVYVIVRLSNEYFDRRKETVMLEAVDVEYLDPPSLYIDTDTLTDCVYVMSECMFSNGSSIDCTPAVHRSVDGDIEFYIVDSRKLLALNIRFFSPTDMLRLEFVLVFKDNGTRADVSECISVSASAPPPPPPRPLVQTMISANPQPVVFFPGWWQTVILLSDVAIVDAFLNNTRYNPKHMGALTFVGYGQSSHYSFGLEQEFFVNSKKAKNTTAFGQTQYPYVNRNALQVLVSPSTFTVRKIQHNKGQGQFELMGGIFGWFGILVGASIYSLFNDFLGFVERARKRAQMENDLDDEAGLYEDGECLKTVKDKHVTRYGC